jgi:uncharacterized delta-60 repeat protein
MQGTRVVAGVFSAIFFLLILGSAGAAPGDLDPRFADDGIGQVQIGSGSQATGLVLQPDGKIVLGGWTSDSHTALARYLPDGSLDSTFGSGGIVVGPSGQAYSMALQADGKILLAGWGANGNFGFFVVRFLPDGSLDTTFGSNGIASGPGGYALGIALQPDGHIVLAGNDVGDRFVLARFDPAGALDPGFGTNGVVRTRIGHGSSEGRSVVVQPDGKIVAAGTTGTGIPEPPYSVMALARYLPDGSLDPAFGSGGTVTAAIGSTSASASSLALQANGRLIAAGTIDDQFGVARFLPDGSLDTSFAAHGVATTSVGSYAYGNVVALQPDGRIVVAGSGLGNFALVRYEPDGALDARFGEGGVALTAVGSYSSAYALALQPDGRILAAGSSTGSPGSQFTLARYLVTTPSTITGGPLIVDYGESVQLSGALTTRQPGSVSVLQRGCSDSSTSTAATTSARADGTWAASVAPEERTEYRAGVGLERSAGLTVWVRPRLTLTRASAGSLRARAVFGHTLAGESIVLQRYSKRKGGRWLDHRNLPMRRVGARGSDVVSGATFRVRRRPGRRLRIVLPHDSAYDCFQSAASPAIRG